MKTHVTLVAFFFLLGNVDAQQGKPSAPVADSLAEKSIANSDTNTYDVAFTLVNREASFPGGAKSWMYFLENNQDKKAAWRDKLKTGYYTVYVDFVVNKDGSISNVKVNKKGNQCPSCVADAQQLMKKSPRWIPAVVNRHNIKYKVHQQITYAVADF